MLVQTLVFLMLGSCALFGLTFPPSDLLAALPGVDGGWMVGCRAGADGVSVILERALCPAISVRGMLATERGAQLMGRLRIPVDLSPVFYAIDIGTQGVGGWMTLLLGPVSVDLGRQWAQKRRVLQPLVSLLYHFFDANDNTMSANWSGTT